MRLPLLLALICLLPACSSTWNQAYTTSSQDDHALVEKTRSTADQNLLESANRAVVPVEDTNQPLATVWGRANGGSLSELKLKGVTKKASDVPDRVGGGTSYGHKPGEEVQPVELQFVDTSLRSVIDLLFAQYLKTPYSVLPDFREVKVNWIVSGNYTKDEILHMFETFLESYGVTFMQRGNTYYISSQPQRAGGGTPATLGQATGIWRLEHVDAHDLVVMVRSFISTPDRVLVLESGNILMITANGNEIRNVDSFLTQVDVPALDNRHIMIYTPRFVSPQALVTLLEAMPKRLGSSIADPKKVIDAEAIAGSPNVVIVTSNETMRQAVLDLIRSVDQEGRNQRQIFYYTARTQKVEDIRSTLDQMVKSIVKEQDPGQAISIIASPSTNSLLITATADEFYRIKKIIDRIDYSLPSLLLDAAVVEVSLNDELAYGVEWYLRGKIGGGVVNFATVNPVAPVNPTLAAGALSLHNDIVATLNALSQKTKVQVLSRPRVVVRNKDKAIIKSVREIRILKTTSNSQVQTGGTSQLLNEYDSKEVGITLEVTPTISTDGTISMVLHIIDSSQGPQTNGQPSFDKREVDTQFIINNGETVFLGGVIKHNNTLGRGGVPLLGDLPYLGNLFGGTDATTEASELIVLVTPYVYYDKYAARILTDAYAGFFKGGVAK